MTAAPCDQLLETALERRPANALNIEIGTALARCKMKPPEHWPTVKSSRISPTTRWLMSGGSALVFGSCSRNCPLRGHNGGPLLDDAA